VKKKAIPAQGDSEIIDVDAFVPRHIVDVEAFVPSASYYRRERAHDLEVESRTK
jgi:hypothetical protein